MSTGTETLFASRLDPIVRPREVFHFHRPETLLEWVTEEAVLRAAAAADAAAGRRGGLPRRSRSTRCKGWRSRSATTTCARWSR